MSWLDVLLAPHEVRPAPNAPPRPLDPREAAAMLFAGLRAHFESGYREQSDLPTEPDLSRPDGAFWCALERYVDGDHDGTIDVCLDLAAMPETSPDLRVASGVLASIALADDRRHVRAVEVLDVVAEEVGGWHADDVARAVARLHLGWRQAELARWAEAIAATEEALALVADGGGRVERIVTSVGLENLANLRWRAGEPRFDDIVRLQELPPVPARLRPRMHLASALTRHLGEALEERLAHPLSWQVRFQAEDRAEGDFAAASLQAECLATSTGIAQVRGAMAQSRLVHAIDHVHEPAPDTFWLLLTSRDHKLLKTAARWQMGQGPLDTIAAEVARVVLEPPPALYEQSTLALLSAAGDLCDTEQANAAVTHLLELIEEDEAPSVRRTFSLAVAAFEALTGTLSAASGEHHDLVADRLADMVAGTENPATLQHEIPRVLRTLRWSELSATTQQRWQRYAERDDTHAGDAANVSTTVVFALSSLDPDWAEHVALQAYREQRDATWAAVLVDVAGHVPTDVGREVVDEALDHMHRERRSAARRHYAMGGVRAPLLAAALVLQDPALPGWGDVCDYLADPAVDLESKELVANLAVRRRGRIDEQMTARLREAVEGGLYGRAPFVPDSSGREARGPWLRLAVAFGLRPIDHLVAELIELAHDRDPAERIEACWTIPQLSHDLAVLQLLIHLTYDAQHDVRAAAAGTALRLVVDTQTLPDGGGTPLLHRRVDALFSESGRAVPRALLQVADQVATASLEPFRAALTQLASHHRSAAVRGQARTQLARYETKPQ